MPNSRYRSPNWITGGFYFLATVVVAIAVVVLIAGAKRPPANPVDDLPFLESRVDELSRVVAAEQYPRVPRVAKPNGPLIVRELYAYRANAETKTPDWICYHVDAKNFGPTRPRRWANDPSIAPRFVLDYRPNDDFAGSAAGPRPGDRGHLPALASFAGHPAWPTVNFYSVIGIQSPTSNRGPIKAVEQRIRDIASAGPAPFVVWLPVRELDGVADTSKPILPNADESYVSPAGWACVVRVAPDSVYCYVIPQTATGSDVSKFATSIDTVEQITGVEL